MIEQEKLYINDKLIELGGETSQFSRTLQVNDLVSLDNRQTNYTQNIKIPKTPKNVLNMDYLGVLGNNSNLPYQKNTIKYFVGNEAIIYNGWGVFSETNDYYNLTVYDGNIDLYKSIENTTLGELDLSGLDHSKNLTTVVDSFSSTALPYKYILADYNGQSTYVASGTTSGSTINIDYLVPSVKVSYLWDKIFEKYGFTYDGTIFSNDDFLNLWLTYPKAIDFIGTTTDIYINENTRFQSFASTYDGINSLYFYVDGSASTFNLDSVINDKHFKVAETASYKIEITGEIIPTGNDGSLSGVKCDIWLCKNSQSITNANDVTPVELLVANVGGDYTQYYSCDGSKIVSLNAGDTFSIIIRRNDGKNLRYVTEKSENKLQINVKKIDGGDVNFSSTLIDFSTKDFLNEIIQRFGLSIFKDKYTNKYDFKTLSEIINSNNPIDWSDKFQSIESERYIYGNYAQKNLLKYKYNDNNGTYNDGYINIDNENLNDSKTIIQSKIYSPESKFSNELGFPTNVYKLWNKEINDKKDINYKSLENRFHLLRATTKTFGDTTRIGSYSLQSIQTITTAPVETFSRLPFQDIVSNYYPSVSKILNKSKVIIANINLKHTDITDFDFTKLYFVKQLGNYFLVNKIVNFQIGKQTKVEMIKVDYSSVPTSPEISTKNILIKPVVSGSDYCLEIEMTLPTGYSTLVGVGTYIKINNSTTGFLFFTNVSGNTYKLLSYNDSITNDLVLNEIAIKVTDGINVITYSNINTPLTFTSTDLTNLTSKNLDLNIT
jgi:hypothetical protein